MNDVFDNIKLYLPQYLPEKEQEELFNELEKFPSINESKFYISRRNINDMIVYQGDGLKDMLVVHLPEEDRYKCPVMIFSNSCDVDVANKRRVDTNVLYAPILILAKYIRVLKEENLYDKNHIEAIKAQKANNIFYLPKGDGLAEESIVFLDRICSCSNDSIDRTHLQKIRLFTLDNYSHYLFLLKLSLHFTRLHNSVDRKTL